MFFAYSLLLPLLVALSATRATSSVHFPASVRLNELSSQPDRATQDGSMLAGFYHYRGHDEAARTVRRAGPPEGPTADILGQMFVEHQGRWADAMAAAHRIVASARNRPLSPAQLDRVKAHLGTAQSWHEIMESISREMQEVGREPRPPARAPGHE